MEEERKGRRLVLIPFPLQGHINPMVQLAEILYSKGFTITIIHTSFNSPNPSNYPHFTFFPIQDGLRLESSSLDILNLIHSLNVTCVGPFREMLAKVVSDVEEDPVSCLVSDAQFYFAQGVANEFKVPRIVLMTTGASAFVPFVFFPMLRQRGYLPIQESELEQPVTELPPLKVKDLPVLDTKEPEKFYKEVSNLVEYTKSSSGLILNTFHDLEQSPLSYLAHDFQIPIFPIGPFHKCPFPSSSSNNNSSLLTQDQSCISWLDKHEANSVVYVSFGSLAATNEKDLLEIALGLANSLHPFLWVVRKGMVIGSEWVEALPNGFIEGLDGRGYIVKWAPQQEVLAHKAVGAFWTHSGWNSTLESITEGVPMICMPCFTDQLVNARYVSHVWKVGLRLDRRNIERDKIVKIVRELMEGKEGMEIRKRALDLKEKATLRWTQGGSSYRSLDGLVDYILSFQPIALPAS